MWDEADHDHEVKLVPSDLAGLSMLGLVGASFAGLTEPPRSMLL